ncbi:Ger(x)C family spore germination protein [Ornithinibacillus sp. FSL M8-0202]|uniref:Ger(x)C family spore germination protein n=1 Tax=unclassified Ornithinibacillus TaxID=2620869 RepID=UPI0030D59033
MFPILLYIVAKIKGEFKNAKNQKALSFVLLFAIFLSLTGCWDQRGVEEYAFVIALGMDKVDNQKDKVRITYLIANPETGSVASSASSQEPPRGIISFEANSLITAKSLANIVIAKEITYDLVRMLFVSEELARDKEFVRWIYDAAKSMDIRRDIQFLVTKEETSQFIQTNKPLLETRPHDYYEKIFNVGEIFGTTPPSELNTFFRITEADADLFLGMYGTTEKVQEHKSNQEPDQIKAGEFHYTGETNTTQIAGSAVFKEGRMIDTLTIEETKLTYLLNPTLKTGYFLFTFPDPFDEDYRVDAQIELDNPIKIDMNLKKDTPKIDVTVPISLEVLSNHSMTDYSKDPMKQDRLESSIKEDLANKFKELIKKTQEEFKSEPFNWSLIARKEFPTIPDWEKFDWMKTYPDMDINVSVQLKLEKFGRQNELPRIEEMRD